MNLKEIIEATLIELDRGTAADTVSMYAPKFTVYANEAVDEIARRFKVTSIDGVTTESVADPSGYPYFIADGFALNKPIKRILKVMPAAFDENDVIVATDDTLKKPYRFFQQLIGTGLISILDKDRIEPGDPVWVQYTYVPTPMNVASLTTPVGDPPAIVPDTPDIPEMFHSLIPLYVRAREQCGQDPSTQGTSSAYFQLFNQKVYQLQRETLATPDSFKLIGYHFD